MKAISQDLELIDAPTPEPGEGERLMRVAAAGVNRGDILQNQGHYPPPAGVTSILGLEASGYVDDEPAIALLSGGGYAEYVVVPEGQLMPVPKGLTMPEAATIAEVTCTVWSNVFMLAGLHKGQRVLIHGGAGGIGTCAIQLAKHFGAEVAVTAGSAEKLATCKELGADILINYKEQDFAQELKNSCDVILDIIGAKYLDQNVRALAYDGHQVTIGMQGGVKGELNIGRLLSKRGSISATALRARDREDKARIVKSTVENVWPVIESGVFKPQLSATLPLDQAAEAHRLIKEGEVTGKIALTVAED
ncbi:NAD(P)H-quinone oxidoreductase [Corynebacterium pyruviciproducens]|uniref:NAD(P)H-quinone oxidoreductase n=1 Tax=Corynebacterium pyruviciproducens TaxID=598660 RepID=UPI0025515333|nr:NAD(P)H-quinone oxidoreductase [Corynebacterium pyruviciproducens]MDK6565678.1 NAD(P)H-quinone oxidoreductase [Corynebacterium pyruviciproducens]MDK7214288.1 NAD(P)H-quinone oxidoreductase [Corynebacterium pyruviciproducens]